jgi:hypothetical protein
MALVLACSSMTASMQHNLYCLGSSKVHSTHSFLSLRPMLLLTAGHRP